MESSQTQTDKPNVNRRRVGSIRDQYGALRPIYEIDCARCSSPHQTRALRTIYCRACLGDVLREHAASRRSTKAIGFTVKPSGKRQAILRHQSCAACQRPYHAARTTKTCSKQCADARRAALAKLRHASRPAAPPTAPPAAKPAQFSAELWAASEVALQQWIKDRLADLSTQYPDRKWTQKTLFFWEETTPHDWRAEWCQTQLVEQSAVELTDGEPQPVPGYGRQSPTEWNIYA